MIEQQFNISDTARIGHVHLNVTNLGEERAFYEDILGLQIVKERDRSIWLAPLRQRYATDASDPIIRLTKVKHSLAKSRRTAGLYHLAVLLPTRKDLAMIFKHVYDRRWRFQGFADHGVSEALYLADPEGNGIELYADRPRDRWVYVDGQLHMTTDPLDIDDLLSELVNDGETDEWNGIAAGTVIGHVHLQVSDLNKAERFYHTILGFNVMQRSYPGALFVSAGRYHHHIGMNVWAGHGLPPADPDAPGLRSFSIAISDIDNRSAIKNRLKEFSIPFEEDAGEGNLLIKTADFDGIQIHIR
jgi:catechol 2,3-dioxygenase